MKPEIVGKTLAELNAMSKADIISALLEDVRETARTVTQDPKRGDLRVDEITKDAYGKVTGKRSIVTTYYESKEVDEITVTDMDPAGKVIGGYVVKHYRDERQPTLTPIEPEKKRL